MSRKTTKFSRKRQATGGTFDGGAFVTVLQKCRAYTEEPIPGTNIAGTMSAATKSMLKVREGFIAIKNRTTAPDNTHDFELLTHALGVATIRACQIGGGDVTENRTLEDILSDLNSTLRSQGKVIKIASNDWGKNSPIMASKFDPE